MVGRTPQRQIFADGLRAIRDDTISQEQFVVLLSAVDDALVDPATRLDGDERATVALILLWLDAVVQPDDTTALRESTSRLSRLFEDPALPEDIGVKLAARLSFRASALGLRDLSSVAATRALELQRKLVDADPDRYPGDLAELLLDISTSFNDAGRPQEALAPAEEATSIRRRLVAENLEGELANLAISLSNMTSVLLALRRQHKALASAEECVSIRRGLAGSDGATELSALARGLANLAVVLGELGRAPEAIAPSEEAAQIRRSLVMRNAESELPSLARSLTILADTLGEVGRAHEGVIHSEEAVMIGRWLTGAHARLAHLSDLAVSLHTFANQLARVGRREEALDVAREAYDLMSELARDSPRPDAYLPELASSKNQLSVRLAEAGLADDALEAAEGTLEMRRQLAAADRAYLPALAISLNNVANRRAAVGRASQALAAGEEALAIRESLVEESRGDLPVLAHSLNNISVQLAELGRREDALAPAEEAVSIYLELKSRHPSSYLPDLAMSLSNLANRLAELGRGDEAVVRAREAAKVYRGLDQASTGAFLPHLAAALNNLANWLAGADRGEESLVPAEEAVAIYRSLGDSAPAAFLGDLAISLNSLSVRLAERQFSEDALRSAREAESIYRSLAQARPAAELPGLAMSLNNLAVRLAEHQEVDEALAAAREAVTIYRVLAHDTPAHVTDLALSLNNLATTLEAAGHTDDALAASLEAAQLPVGLRERARSLRRLLLLPAAQRSPSAGPILVQALAELVDTAAAEVLQVGTAQDRRRLADETAWLVSAGAVFLATEAEPSRAARAVELLDSMLALEARLVAAIHDREFRRLAVTHPELATRLQQAVTRRMSDFAGVYEHAATADRPVPRLDTVKAVLAEIRLEPAFSRFLAARTTDEIASGLHGQPAAWVVFGPSAGAIVTLDPTGRAEARRLLPTSDDLVDLLDATLEPSSTSDTYLALRRFVDEQIAPELSALARSDALAVVVPVGLAAWLPIQSRLEDIGSHVEVRPVLSMPSNAAAAGGGPLVVHSDGRPGIDQPLEGALAETRAVAQLLGVAACTDPDATPDLVLTRLHDSPVIHLACHGAFDTDPWRTRLRLGEAELTVGMLSELLATEDRSPLFVGLNACETARTETLAPEQALGFPVVFLSNGVRAVLVTLWPVTDDLAREIAVQFYSLWRSGGTAGEAFATAIVTHRLQWPESVTVDAYCLYGDRSLAFPRGGAATDDVAARLE